MAKYKFNNDFTQVDVTIKKGSVVTGSVAKNKDFGNSELTFNLNGKPVKLNLDFFKTTVSRVPDATAENLITEKATGLAGDLGDASKEIMGGVQAIQIASLVGILSGVGFAYYRKSKWYGYIGWALLGSIVIGTGMSVYQIQRAKKALAAGK